MLHKIFYIVNETFYLQYGAAHTNGTNVKSACPNVMARE